MTAAKIVMTADDCYGRKSLDVVSDQRDPNINIVVRRCGIKELCAYSLQGDMQSEAIFACRLVSYKHTIH